MPTAPKAPAKPPAPAPPTSPTRRTWHRRPWVLPVSELPESLVTPDGTPISAARSVRSPRPVRVRGPRRSAERHYAAWALQHGDVLGEQRPSSHVDRGRASGATACRRGSGSFARRSTSRPSLSSCLPLAVPTVVSGCCCSSRGRRRPLWRRVESALTVVAALLSRTSPVSLVAGPHLASPRPARLFLSGAIATMLRSGSTCCGAVSSRRTNAP